MKMGDVHANDPSREDHDAKGQRPGAVDETLEQRASAEALLLFRQLKVLRDGDERVLKEVAIFADRIDISEELTRLESHFKQFADCASAKVPVGRTLDFLSQEMNREINTIGSKANDATIANCVVEAKTVIERIREQVQNIQ